VIDTAGVLMGAGAAGLFGISFGLLPALILLAVLAVYDAISVYGTEHMLSLAEGVMDLNIPVVLVIPLSLSYSLLDGEAASEEASGVGEESASDAEGSETADSDADAGDAAEPGDPTEPAEPGDRDAFFIGLGDAVIPTVLIASAATFSPATALSVPLLGVNLPALLAMVGTLAGLLVLMRWVIQGRPHAGLPLLNGGAIGGYLIGSVVAGVPLIEALGLAAFF
jgi:presenilin-like A22 family membrane protease